MSDPFDLGLMKYRLYVTDESRLLCYEDDCLCEGGPIEVDGRRVTLADLIEAIGMHREQYGVSQ